MLQTVYETADKLEDEGLPNLPIYARKLIPLIHSAYRYVLTAATFIHQEMGSTHL